MLSKWWLLVFLVFFIHLIYAEPQISTNIEVDIYGTTEIAHNFPDSLTQIELKVYNPESLSIVPESKYFLNGSTLILKDVIKGTKIIYLSNTLAEKEGFWKIEYLPIQEQSVRLVLPFNSKIVDSSENSFQSKDNAGMVIEWDSTQKAMANYKLLKEASFDWKIPFLIALISVASLVGYIIYKKINSPLPPPPVEIIKPEADKFIERMKGTKRIIVRQVIYAILMLAYEKQDRLIDPAKIRGILKENGFNDINSHKSEIHGVINGEIDFLIIRNESKIEINPKAEIDYGLKDNAKVIIKEMKQLIIPKTNNLFEKI